MRSFLILFLVSVHVVVPEHYEVGGYLTKGKSLDLDNLSKTDIEGIAYRKVAALFDNCTITINSFDPTKDVINFQGVLVSSAPLTEEEKSILLNHQDTVRFFWIYKPLGSLEHTEPVKSRMQSDQNNYCKNNGVLLADNTCDCRPYTSGTRCEQISCQHWGIPTNPNVIGPVDKRCHCPPGRYSEFCETRGCQPGIEENLSGGVRTLIIVISSIPQMAEERKYINDNINQTINTLKSREPGWIGNYLLMLTITTETAMATAKLPFESSEKLVDFLQTSDVSSADYAFNQKIIFSIKDIQNYADNMYPYSTVLVFANRPDGNGPPSISNTSITHEMAVVQQSLTWRSRIYFFITQTEEEPMNTSSYGYDTYRRVAANTHGELLLLNKSELPNVLQNFVTRLYKQEYLDAQSYIPCNTIQTKLVRDYAGQDVSVMITVDKNPGTPKNAIPNLVCDGNVINPDFHGKYWQLYSVPAGVSDLRVGSDDALICSYRVFVSSRSTLLTSFSGNKMVDVGDGMQSPQASGFVMAQPNSFPIFTYSYMEIMNATGQSSGKKYQSTLRSKSSCTAELLFEIPNPCTTGPFTQRHTFTVTATQQMQRVYPGYCADKIATTPPIPHPQPTIANVSSDFQDEKAEQASCCLIEERAYQSLFLNVSAVIRRMYLISIGFTTSDTCSSSSKPLLR